MDLFIKELKFQAKNWNIIMWAKAIIKEFCVGKSHVQIIALKDYLHLQCGKNELKQIERTISRVL